MLRSLSGFGDSFKFSSTSLAIHEGSGTRARPTNHQASQAPGTPLIPPEYVDSDKLIFPAAVLPDRSFTSITKVIGRSPGPSKLRIRSCSPHVACSGEKNTLSDAIPNAMPRLMNEVVSEFWGWPSACPCARQRSRPQKYFGGIYRRCPKTEKKDNFRRLERRPQGGHECLLRATFHPS